MAQWNANANRDLTPRNTKAYRQLVAQVREDVRRDGLRCWFEHQRHYEDCPGDIDLTLHPSHAMAYTMHHLDRLADGGDAVPPRHRVAPAHRRCNSRDGLRAFNARRAGTTPGVTQDRTSRAW